MSENFINNKYFELWLENGIIHYRYKPELIINKDIAKMIVNERIKNFGGITRPSLVDGRASKGITQSARKYLASEEAMHWVNAGALVLDGAIQVLLGNAFLMINRPRLPSKIFTNPEEAKEWLNQFKAEIKE